jgi:hypothetical protein
MSGFAVLGTVLLLFAWEPLGQVKLDGGMGLVFPKSPARPGLYRFEISTPNSPAVYIGETELLPRRFQNYRTPGVSQITNERLNLRLKDVLKAGGKVSVSIITRSAYLDVNGKRRVLDLTRKHERVLAEHAAIVGLEAEPMKILNR